MTGTGAVCAAGMAPDGNSRRRRGRALAIGPDRAVGHDRLADAVSPAEIADFNPRALVDDRKLHKLIRRTDLLGLYAAGRAIERSGIVAHRDTLDAADAAAYSDRTGVYRRLRRRQFREPVRFPPVVRPRPAANLPDFGRELAEHRESDVAAAHAAQQRARPHRHQARAQGHECLHHQPQRRRHAGGHRGVRRRCAMAKPTAPWPSDTKRRSNRRWCSITSGSDCSPAKRCVRSTRATTAACSARAPARCCWKPRLRQPRATRRCWAKSSAAAMRAKRRG